MRCRAGAEAQCILVHEIVDVLSRDPGFDQRADSTESVRRQSAHLAHELDLTISLDLDGTARKAHVVLGRVYGAGVDVDRTC